jgi:sporulation protein YlmC with PRC-barrel domain
MRRAQKARGIHAAERRRAKMCSAVGTVARVACFSSAQFISRRNDMFAKYMTAGLVASALLATVAFAQNPATTDRAGSTTLSSSSLQGSSWRASKMVGLSVYNDNNESLGTINDLLMDKNGNTKAVVIGVGGFLGVGEHLVAVPFEKIKFINEPAASTGSSASNTSGNRPASSTTTGSSSSATSSNPNLWYPDHAVFNTNKEELKAMPEFKYSS